MQYAPEWTLSAGYQHDFPIGAGSLRARVDTRYEDEFWGTFRTEPWHATGRLFQDRRVAHVLPGRRPLERRTVGPNIENVAVLAATTTGQFGPYGDAFIEPPRIFGARFTFKL